MPPRSGHGRPCATRTSASGRRGPGRKCSRKFAPSRSASPNSASSAATNSPSSAATARGSIGRCARARRSAPYRCRSMPTPWPTRWPTCLAHAEVTLAVVEDQEQVDKIIAVSDRLPHLGQVIYDEPRGLKDYDPQPVDLLSRTCRASAAKSLRAIPNVCGNGKPASRRARAAISASSSTRRERPAAPRA